MTPPYYHGFQYPDGEKHVTRQNDHGAEELSAPKGFDWGTLSPQVTDLARAILSDVMDNPCSELVEAFAIEHVSTWDTETFEIPVCDVVTWVEQKSKA